MIGLDTHVRLRLGDHKEPVRKPRAGALVRGLGAAGSFVNPVVLCEFAWTLARLYKLSRIEVADRIGIFLEVPESVVAHAEEAERALALYRGGPADFADCFLAEINRAAGCHATATFDGDALKSGDLFMPIPALS